jgi:hypothetical protein
MVFSESREATASLSENSRMGEVLPYSKKNVLALDPWIPVEVLTFS